MRLKYISPDLKVELDQLVDRLRRSEQQQKARYAEYAVDWDPKKHPRGQPQNAGQFAEKPGGTSGRAYISPNQGKPVKFPEASRRAASGETKSFAQKALSIAREKGVKASVHRVVGDWAPSPAESGAEPSLELAVHDAQDYDQIKYVASLLGKQARQIAVLPWQDMKGGPDSMWELVIHDNPEHIRKILDERKLPYRTLVGQSGGKTRVVIFDQGSELKKQIVGVAKHYGIQVQRRTGKGEFWPPDAAGDTDDAKRTSAIKEYDRFIGEYEGRRGRGNPGHNGGRAGSDIPARPTGGQRRSEPELVGRMRRAEKTLKARYARHPAATMWEIVGYAHRAGLDISRFDPHQLVAGFEVELEHGTVNSRTNVTGNDPVKTLKIAVAHLREDPHYYTKLKKIENGK